MRAFTDGELARLRATQEGAMQDTCKVLSYSSTDDDYNLPAPDFAPGDPTPCGLEHVGPEEMQQAGNVPVIDARIRLALGTSLDPRDRIQVTHRYGEALSSPQLFEIVGEPRQGPSGLWADLALVDDE